MRPEVKRIFANMLADFKSSVRGAGTPFNARDYLQTWQGTVNNHYLKTQRMFSGMIFNPDPNSTEDEKMFGILLLALAAWRKENADTASKAITDTNNRQMSKALGEGRQALYDEGIENPTNLELALTSTASLKKKFAGRIEGIVSTETQSASEFTKFAEASVYSGANPMETLRGVPPEKPDVAKVQTKKIWRTVGDARVRKIHLEVDGQKRSLNEPFVVNNEFLMHPGDRTSGASVGNVANCRCVSEYEV